MLSTARSTVAAVSARCRTSFSRVARAVPSETAMGSRSFSSPSSGSSKIISPYFIPLFPDSEKPKTADNEPPPNCDVVQGPSLLRTPAPRPHPTLMIMPGMRSLPFWTSDSTPTPSSNPGSSAPPPRRRIAYNDPSVSRAVEYLEQHADIIREEYLRVAPSLPSDYENLQDHTQGSGDGKSNDTKLHDGDWDWHTYLSKGNVQGDFVMKFPETSKILNDGFRGEENNYQLFEGTPFGFVFFSNLGGGAKIAPHNAPTNLRLRIHLPIIVNDESVNPETGIPNCGIRVATSIRPYKQNNAIVLDDAYDHEVWNETAENRVVLLVDIWHPDVTQAEKEAVVEMFQKAKRDGLWKR
ncbi:unnamed protein product [Pseudo-nitzschia multistriata]|uniref:Aspartyl/asparaginy/proline hydroxylase domain-containing protein n=1 Tax=Pseudo-nitzschia multistriata TaxID=183589 RepID=A0A448ZS21_9STRA|nr:unnamed protein product [Pseudo-nitzschia multistriata]